MPAGKNLKTNCPFHKEKTPSFMVSPDRQTWHCFGCGIGGDIIAFLMRYENLEFIEALKILGEKAGVDIGRAGTQDQKAVNILYEINKAAKEFFKQTLRQAQGEPAIEYLKARGLKGETAKEFEIGFAPDSVDLLYSSLTGAGFNIIDVEKAGLAFKTDRGTYIDRFRNRIMFPLYNHFGKVVGFTGRIMPGHENENIGKYVNSPETLIFNKSKILYGFDKSKNAIRDIRYAILVEGQMDFIMAWQDGLKNLVATSGTALTAEHLKSLRRVADHLILSFDQDEAGRLATERAIDLAGAADLSVRVMKVPADINAKDPADIAMARPGLLKTLAESAQPAMDYYFDRYKINDRKGEWKKNMRTVLSKIKFMASPVERAHWLQEVAKLSGIDENYLTEEMENIKVVEPQQARPEEEGPTINAHVSRKEVISQRIASLVLNYRDVYQESEAQFKYLPENYQSIVAYYFDPKKLSLSAELQSLADLVGLRSGLEISPDPQHAKAELKALFRQLRFEQLKEQRQEISLAIQESERKGNDAVELLTKKQQIAEEMRQLEAEVA